MKAIQYAVCSKEGCDHLATVVNGEKFHRCLHDLEPHERDELISLLQTNEKPLCNSVFDGRDDEGAPSYRLPCSLPKGADLRGSLFVGVDFSSVDFDEVDFSYSHFHGCDLRRTKLHNVSLRMTWLIRCLVRQANIDHSDARWMISCIPEFEQHRGIAELLLEPMARRRLAAVDKRLRLVPKEDNLLFLRYLGLDIEQEDEISCFDKEKYQELIRTIKEIYNGSKDEKTGKRKILPDIFRFRVGFETETDWSGATFRDSDLAYARFDNTIAHETAFDGSDLHCATFAHAQLSRSSFANVSFSRINGSPNNAANETSRFLGTIMDGCVLNGANLEAVFFEETKMPSARLTGARLAGAVFFKCDLKNITGDYIDANEACFLASDLSGASLHSALFPSAKFWWPDKESKPRCLPDEVKNRILATWAGMGEDQKITRIKGANLQATDFQQADLRRAHLTGSLFRDANLSFANLIEAICIGTYFLAANITGTFFSKTNLNSADLSNAGTNSSEFPPKFKGADLGDAILKNMDLSRVDFVNLTSMEGVDFSNCKLLNTQFRSTDPKKQLILRRAIFRNTQIDNVQFINADLQASDFSFCRGEGDDFVTFKACCLRVANLRAVNIKKVKWENCDLQKVDISDSEIETAFFRKQCNLETASFSDATIQTLEINQPINITDVSFKGAKIGDENGQKSILIGSENTDELIFHNILNFDRAAIFNFSFQNIGFVSSSFKYILFREVSFVNTFICFGEFFSSAIHLSSIQGSSFIDCDFTKSDIRQFYSDLSKQNKLPEDTAALLGCNFSESDLFEHPEGIIFIDCTFTASSFLGKVSSAKNWSKALLIQCSFSRQKYQGIKDAQHDVKTAFLSDDSITLREFMRNYCSQLSKEESRLEAVRRRGKVAFAARLEDLIPEMKERNNKTYSYAATYDLCKEIRKDLFASGLTETGSIAYVLERTYYRNSISFFKLPNVKNNLWMLPAKSKNLLHDIFILFIQKDRAIETFRTSSFFFSIILCLYASIFLFLSEFLSGLALAAPAFILLPGFTQKGRLLLSEYLYDYGESVGKMLWAAVGCVFAFAILFYGFLPCQKITNRPPLVAFYKQLYTPSSNTDSGYFIEDGNVLTKKDCKDIDAFVTCLYISGVTFTTLGYGDVQPVGLLRILAMTEAAVGAFLMALFVFSFTRRNAQR